MIIKKDIFLSYVTEEYIVICTRWYPFLCLTNIPHIHRKKMFSFPGYLHVMHSLKKQKSIYFTYLNTIILNLNMQMIN